MPTTALDPKHDDRRDGEDAGHDQVHGCNAVLGTLLQRTRGCYSCACRLMKAILVSAGPFKVAELAGNRG